MSTKSTSIEIIRTALITSGDAFTGGIADEIAEWWDDEFDGDAKTAIEWIVGAGFWDAASARALADAGCDPESEISYKPGRECDHGYGIDPVYAFCNGDCGIDDLEW